MPVRGVFVNASDHRDFSVDEQIFREGDMGSEMFGVVSGKVELRYGAEVVATVGPSETFGEMAIVSSIGDADRTTSPLETPSLTNAAAAARDRAAAAPCWV